MGLPEGLVECPKCNGSGHRTTSKGEVKPEACPECKGLNFVKA